VVQASAIEREILEADDIRVKGLLSNDIDAVEKLLGDDLTYVHSSGRLDTKETYMDALRSGRTRYLTMDLSEVEVRGLGDTGVITNIFDAKVQTANGEVTLHSRALLVYAKRDGRWQLIAYESTPTS
jgi:ketosteroid isomerase-like protein